MTTTPIPIKGPRLKHDGTLIIAAANTAKAREWRSQELTWSTIAARLKEPTRTQMTVAEYHAAPKSAQDSAKDVGGYLKGPARGGRRRSGHVQSLYLLALDIDYPEAGLVDVLRDLYDFAWIIHSTHSHRPDRPRLRLIAPLRRSVSGDEWQAVARRLAADLGIDQFDPTTFELERLNYWPAVPRDGEYIFELSDAPWLDPDELLARYDDWRDPYQWPVHSKEGHARKRSAEKAEDPAKKRGIVGAFCRTYSIDSAIETFLSGVYEPHSIEGRYTYVKGSTAGGLIVYDGGKFAYSHHGTDPVGGRLVNAFDLVRIHLFGDADEKAAEGTPVVKLPSYLSMVEVARADAEVRKTLGKERLERAAEDFGDPVEDAPAHPDEDDTDWLAELELDDGGAIKATRHNILVILEHDPRLRGRIKLNEFTGRIMIHGDLPWREKKDRAQWHDRDDSGLRYYLERTYGIDAINKAHDAIAALVERHAYHPVRDYLRGLEWDGIPRAETLLRDYLGAEDSEYLRAVTRKALAAAVARVMRPGCKFDYMLVLIGSQGLGKSYLLGRLGGEWFSDSLATVQGKEAYEALQGAWIIEMGELAATRRAETEAIKHFLTKREDIYRAAYGRHAMAYPRQCVFFGTTNDHSFLKDRTGNRRYWPVEVGIVEPNMSLWDDLTDDEIDQIWAEAVELYDAGEPLYLNPELEAVAREEQEQYTEESDLTGIIREFLDRPIPRDWPEKTLAERIAWLNGAEDFGEPEDAAELVQRDAVCAAEIWCEALRGDLKNLRMAQSREILEIVRNTPGWAASDKSGGRMYFPIYGRQRAMVRSGG